MKKLWREIVEVWKDDITWDPKVVFIRYVMVLPFVILGSVVLYKCAG